MNRLRDALLKLHTAKSFDRFVPIIFQPWIVTSGDTALLRFPNRAGFSFFIRVPNSGTEHEYFIGDELLASQNRVLDEMCDIRLHLGLYLSGEICL